MPIKWKAFVFAGSLLWLLSDNENVQAQTDPCRSALADVDKMDAASAFGSASGVSAFIDMVKASIVGKQLSSCPNVADAAWDAILRAGRDGLNTRPTLQSQFRTAVLLSVYGEILDAAHVDKLKEFIRLRPWRSGFLFASSIAVDALLAYQKDSARDAKYHSYTADEMEQALNKYAR